MHESQTVLAEFALNREREYTRLEGGGGWELKMEKRREGMTEKNWERSGDSFKIQEIKIRA